MNLAGQAPGRRVLVVILNWNGAANTLKCLEHLARQTFASMAVLVIDNGSTDDSVARLSVEAAMPCDVQTLPRNLGFAGGMNVGIRAAMDREADYVWLLNNDAFAEPDCVERLVTFMDQHPSVAMTTPRLLRPNGTEQHAGGQLDWSTCDAGDKDAEELSGPAVWGTWLTGTAPLARTSSLRATGIFDPQYFAFWEDVDLCVRIFRAGGDLRAVPDAIVHHFANSSTGGESSPVYQFLMVRNTWLVLRKHGARRLLPGAFLRFLATSLNRAGLLFLKGYVPAAGAALHGIAAGVLGRYGEPTIKTRLGSGARVLVAHPWRLINALNRAAVWLDWAFRVESGVTAATPPPDARPQPIRDRPL